MSVGLPQRVLRRFRIGNVTLAIRPSSTIFMLICSFSSSTTNPLRRFTSPILTILPRISERCQKKPPKVPTKSKTPTLQLSGSKVFFRANDFDIFHPLITSDVSTKDRSFSRRPSLVTKNALGLIKTKQFRSNLSLF